MIQIMILIGMLLALGASVWKYGENQADAREAELQLVYEQKKAALTAEKAAHEKQMRDFATGLTKGFLQFQKGQDRFYGGVTDAVKDEIRKNPAAFAGVCVGGGADGVRQFNTTGQRGRGGAIPTQPARDGVVPGRTAPAAEGKSPGR